MMHAAHRCRDDGDAVMARVDVHEISLQRRDHEVADAKAEQVLVERQGSVDVWNGQKRVSHTLRAGAETGNVAAGLERGVGDMGAMESFQAVAGRVREGDQVRHTTLVSQRSGFVSATPAPSRRAASVSSAAALATSQPKTWVPASMARSMNRRCLRSSIRKARIELARSTDCMPILDVAKAVQSSRFDAPKPR